MPLFVKLPTCRMLMVTDGIEGTGVCGTFGTEVPGYDQQGNPVRNGYPQFGLSHLLSVVRSMPFVHVTTAHRHTDPAGAADLSDFVFTDDISSYDLIWLLGIGGSYFQETPISPQEASAIEAFMDAGGGIFAFGDHADLGSAMPAQVKRVNKMRYWDTTSGGPPGFSYQEGSDRARIDTVQPDPALGAPGATATHVPFEAQSDAIPALIHPRLFLTGIVQAGAGKLHFPEFLFAVHPLLDLGHLGTLQHLPDHMHEGEIRDVPSAELTGGANGEFPAHNGVQPHPVVVATGKSTGNTEFLLDTTETGFSPDTAAAAVGPYNAIGAYDGRPAGVGRIAVDSTFHHFIDLNLIGDRDFDPALANNPTLAKGFQGTTYLKQFDQYYRNLVLWLAKPDYKIIWYPVLPVWALRDPGLLESLATIGDPTPDVHAPVGARVMHALIRGGWTPSLLLDGLLTTLHGQLLPPTFTGTTDRPILDAATSLHLLHHSLGGATLHARDTLLTLGTQHDEAQAIERVIEASRRGSHAGLKHAATTLRNHPAHAAITAALHDQA